MKSFNIKTSFVRPEGPKIGIDIMIIILILIQNWLFFYMAGNRSIPSDINRFQSRTGLTNIISSHYFRDLVDVIHIEKKHSSSNRKEYYTRLT